MPSHTTLKESISYSKHLVVWSIKNYMQLINKNDKIISPEIPLCKSDLIWKLIVDGQCIYLYTLKYKGKYHTSISLFHDDEQIAYKNLFNFNTSGMNKIFDNLSGKLNNKLSPYDTLTIVCNLRLAKDDNSKLEERDNLKIFQSKNSADILIKVGQQKIRAHRTILTAHNDFFKNILSDNYNVIEIEGIDEDIFRIILKYIYSGGTVDTIDAVYVERYAQQLFIAADKLKMFELKLICETALIETIKFESAIKMLIFADRHSAKELITAAKDFIGAHFYHVSLSDSWQNLKINTAKEVIEILLRKI